MALQIPSVVVRDPMLAFLLTESLKSKMRGVTSEGDWEGELEGCADVGDFVGKREGETVGEREGLRVGAVVVVGAAVNDVGFLVGDAVGPGVAATHMHTRGKE